MVAQTWVFFFSQFLQWAWLEYLQQRFTNTVGKNGQVGVLERVYQIMPFLFFYYLILLHLIRVGLAGVQLAYTILLLQFWDLINTTRLHIVMICMVYFSIAIFTMYKVICKRLSIKLSKLNIQLIQLSISKSSL